MHLLKFVICSLLRKALEMKLIYFTSLLFITLFCQQVMAEIAVIVHPSNNANIEKVTVSRIFLGKLKSFPGGAQAVPITQKEGSAINDEFNKKVLKKSSSQLKAYWSKLVFTGKGTPPRSLNSDAEVLSLIGDNPNLIGYIDVAAVTSKVKVVARF
mgnify:CR=1 FL=1